MTMHTRIHSHILTLIHPNHPHILTHLHTPHILTHNRIYPHTPTHNTYRWMILDHPSVCVVCGGVWVYAIVCEDVGCVKVCETVRVVRVYEGEDV